MTWERIETAPELPVNHGDAIQLSCQTGYSLAGSDTATCNDGELDISGGVPPFCFGKFCVIKPTNSMLYLFILSSMTTFLLLYSKTI